MNDQLSLVLDQLALRFGETGAHLWQALVAYEKIQGAMGLVVGGFAVVVSVVLLKAAKAANSSDDTAYLMIVAGAVAILALIFTAAFLPIYLVPEAVVLKNLLSGAL